MADNTIVNPGVGGITVATDDIGGVHYPRTKVAHGVDGAAVDASVSNPFPTVQTGALPAGANNIGDVDVLTVPADPFGANADAASATGSISAKLRFIAATGIPITGTVTVASHAVTNAGTFAVQADTELPAATAMADGAANPTAPFVAAALAFYNGATWDRARGDTTNGLDVDVTRLPALVAGSANIGDVDVLTVPADPFGVNADAASATGSISAKLRFIAATGIPITGTVTTKETRSGTGTTTQVADSASSVTVLASNASRLGATIANDSTATLYLKMGTTASLTDYTVTVVTGAYYEVPFNYTGRIDGIWATDPNTGSARVTEFT